MSQHNNPLQIINFNNLSAINPKFEAKPIWEEHVNEEKDDEHAEAVLKTITKLTGGYNRIARRFIMPAAEKHEAFSKINLEEEL